MHQMQFIILKHFNCIQNVTYTFQLLNKTDIIPNISTKQMKSRIVDMEII